MIKCCYQCKDRKQGCHATCERYKKELKELHEEQKWLKENNYSDALHPEFSKYKNQNFKTKMEYNDKIKIL